MEKKNISNEIMKGIEFLKEKILSFFSFFSKEKVKTDLLFDEKKKIIIESKKQSQKKKKKEKKKKKKK